MPLFNNILQYSDYRTYLHDFYKHKKRSQPGWSYSVWAKQLKLKSPSTLIMVVGGQRNPGNSLIKCFVEYFEFNQRNADYFEDLVRLEKSKRDIRLSVLLMEKLGQQRGGKFSYLDQKRFSTISNWYYYAIRELVNLKNFREDPHWISGKLKRGVSPKEARKAIKNLLELNLIQRNSKGRLVQANGYVTTSNDLADEGLKRFHEQVLDKAHKSIRDIPTDIREVSGTTFALKLRDLPKAKQLIKKFRKDVCQMLEKESADAVYQLEVAFFPLTRIERKTNEIDN